MSGTSYVSRESRSSELDSIAQVLGWSPSAPLVTFAEMWYQVFLWALFSSIFVHVIAAAIAFATLRKHKFGKFFPVLILIMGVVAPLTSGVVSSAAVAFVYRASSFQMAPLYALVWGVGQTVMSACYGFTRILATL
ncbi:transmembrane protein 170A [Ischnura elegans]|uniref:transmembrane protein 170A n=1 Tax=Ischnura elegans TaxID=197161 RepID=UPI001ED89C53|nr:transmembrane protein 170A [Ischnura elegans]